LKRYNSYHTVVKELARLDKLPHKYSSCIDRSTIWRWKKESDEKYFGRELSGIDQLEQFLKRPESEAMIKAYLNIAISMSRILIQASQIQRTLRENKEKFIRTIIRYQKHIQLTFILRLCGISTSVFYHWRNQVLKKCTSSPLKLCRRIYPNQLSSAEANRMKELLTNPRFKYWPVNSIAYYAMRNNLLAVSLSTWYNYAGKLGLSGRRIPLKKKYQTGIRANQPHHIWHADITIFRCLNGMKYYVYLLMDNYSRFILNYQVSDRVSAKIRLDSIRQAYDQYIRNPE
jgi:putative transposase